MVEEIDAQELKRMIESEEDVVVIDALPPESYEKRHIPTAVNIPPDHPNFEDKARRHAPDKAMRVAVYCSDEDCQLSPTAASKLEKLAIGRSPTSRPASGAGMRPDTRSNGRGKPRREGRPASCGHGLWTRRPQRV